MYLVLIDNVVYELKTYARAKYFVFKHGSIGAKMLGKAKPVDNLDLFLDRVEYQGRKYRKRKKVLNAF